MAGVMAATFLVALRWLPRGRVEPEDEAKVDISPGAEHLPSRAIEA